jgi:hypothetical protein
MPLSPPPERELLHSRDIVLRGYRRADGRYDIEAHLTDTKTYGSANRDRGYIHAGEPIHGMWLRLTVDEERRIVACEASSDHTPYAICPAAAPNFARLAGLQIKPGFLKEAARRVGGTRAVRICGNCCSRWRPPPTRRSTRPGRDARQMPPARSMGRAATAWTCASPPRWAARRRS